MSAKVEKVSIVMCTYNGERFLKQQLDSIINQTYPIHEILIQDDNSNDNTQKIIKEFQQLHPKIKFSINKGERGINNNFFNLIFKASGDLIAISDQDDIWDHDKIKKMMEAIGPNLMCLCRSIAFREDGSFDPYDIRMPNYHLIRMIYISVNGHNMIFRKELLQYLPEDPLQYGYLYDHILSFTAASLESIAEVNEPLVKFRRHNNAATYSNFDKYRTKSVSHAFYILTWSLINFRKIKPLVNTYYKRKLKLLQDIKSKNATKEDALRIMEYEAGLRKPFLIGLAKYHYKYNDVLFYTKGNGLSNKIRSLLYGIMHLYNFKHLMN